MAGPRTGSTGHDEVLAYRVVSPKAIWMAASVIVLVGVGRAM